MLDERVLLATVVVKFLTGRTSANVLKRTIDFDWGDKLGSRLAKRL